MGMKRWYKNHKGKDKNNWSPESIQLLCVKKKKLKDKQQTVKKIICVKLQRVLYRHIKAQQIGEKNTEINNAARLGKERE